MNSIHNICTQLAPFASNFTTLDMVSVGLINFSAHGKAILLIRSSAGHINYIYEITITSAFNDCWTHNGNQRRATLDNFDSLDLMKINYIRQTSSNLRIEFRKSSVSKAQQYCQTLQECQVYLLTTTATGIYKSRIPIHCISVVIHTLREHHVE